MIHTCIIGVGHWGPNLIRNFNDFADVVVTSVVDTDPERLVLVKERFPGIETLSSATEAIRDPAVQAVVIATPAVTHYELAVEALKNNKHVLVEKPITLNSSQSDELVSLAEERSCVLMVGHVFLFNPGVLKVKELIDEGVLGKVLYIDAVRTNLGPVRHDTNALWDLAAHDISIVNFWLGRNGKRVSATGIKALGHKVEDACFSTVEYDDGVVAHVHASWLNPNKVRQITVVGDKGMIVWDDIDLSQTIKIFDRRVDVHDLDFTESYATHRFQTHMGNVTIPVVPGGEPLKNECRHFVDCVLGQSTCISPGEVGADVVRVLEAADQSLARNGEYVVV